ncbi:uncharacterized protein LOC141844689 [Curcuma longa]|uniref:uncharacterized protein LOC141844689 n=1 Tax=Curcuma longa TaxID=136217 RepID=UPI003D9DDA6E
MSGLFWRSSLSIRTHRSSARDVGGRVEQQLNPCFPRSDLSGNWPSPARSLPISVNQPRASLASFCAHWGRKNPTSLKPNSYALFFFFVELRRAPPPPLFFRIGTEQRQLDPRLTSADATIGALADVVQRRGFLYPRRSRDGGCEWFPTDWCTMTLLHRDASREWFSDELSIISHPLELRAAIELAYVVSNAGKVLFETPIIPLPPQKQGGGAPNVSSPINPRRISPAPVRSTASNQCESTMSQFGFVLC